MLPRTTYIPILFPALLFDWLITLILTLTVFDNIVLEKSAGSKHGVLSTFISDFYLHKLHLLAFGSWQCILEVIIILQRAYPAAHGVELLYQVVAKPAGKNSCSVPAKGNPNPQIVGVHLRAPTPTQSLKL